MTFANTKRVPETTVVFFPACLAGSLNHALKQENIENWKIVKPQTAEQKYHTPAPRDGTGHLRIRLYENSELTTTQLKALVSNFDITEITPKIYALHEDADAMEYRERQAELLAKALKEDCML